MKKTYFLIIIIIILTGCKTVSVDKKGLISESTMEMLDINLISYVLNLETKVIHSEKELQEYFALAGTTCMGR